MTKTKRDDVPPEEADLLVRLTSVRGIFADLRADLDALKVELKAGGAKAAPAVQKRLDSVRVALTNCIKAEIDIDKLRDDRRGYVDGQRPLDLGRARSDIGRALARLRT